MNSFSLLDWPTAFTYHMVPMQALSIPTRSLTTPYPGGEYEILVGTGLLGRLRELAPVPGALVVITDDNVGPLHAERFGEVDLVVTVPAGEAHKTLDTIRSIYDQLLDHGFDRKTTLVSLGGGVVGDMVGFAAATFLRGVNFIQCPTSLLSMVDASVGGKTGVDMPQGKNLIGAFKQPVAVIIDLLTLPTLPVREQRAGMAEVVKHGLLNDPALYESCRSLATNSWAEPLTEARLLAWQELLLTAIEVKRDVVVADPFEQGQRALLNLGHTFAHAIEKVSEFAVNHGEAVAMGLVAAADLSGRLGHCDPALAGDIETVLDHLALPVAIPAGLDPEAIYEAMWSDKKKARGKLNFVLLKQIGQAFLDGNVPAEQVLATLLARRATMPEAT